MDFATWLRSLGVDPASLEPSARASLEQAFRSGPAPTAFAREGITYRAAAAVPASLSEEDRSVDAVIATETPTAVLDFETWRVIDEVLVMEGARVPDQVPLLDSHSRWSVDNVLGSTRSIRVEGATLVGRNHFDEDGGAADRAWGKVKRGHIRDFSIGYRVENHVDIPAGKSQEVNGRAFTAAQRTLRVTTSWRLVENSLTPIGADSQAKVRSASAGRKDQREEGHMDPRFKAWLAERGVTAEQYQALPEAEQQSKRTEWEAGLQAAPPAQRSEPAPVAPAAAPAAAVAGSADSGSRSTEEIAAAAVRAERERVQAVRAEAAGIEIDAAIVQRSIDDGHTVDQARAAFLVAVRNRTPSVGSPNVNVGAGAQAESREALEWGMLARAGLGYDRQRAVGLQLVEADAARAEQGDRYRDWSLVDFCRAALSLEGVRVPVSRDETIRAAFSTVSLTTLLSNVANKALMIGFQASPATALRWCRSKSVRDFKLQTRVRSSDGEDWEVVNGNGEIAHGTLSEWAETYRIDTYAKLLKFTRQMVINDDLGDLTDKGQAMGQGGMRLIDNLVYTHLLANGNLNDSVALFEASTHKNYSASAAALADATLAAAKAMMRKQTGLDGQDLNVEPRFLIVPPELEHTAKKLTESDSILFTAAAAAATPADFGTKNVHQGQFTPVVEPRLSNSSYTGYDVDQWFLAADPAQAPTIEVGFLNGVQRPTLERVELAAEVLGIGFRGFIDVGVKALDYRGLYKSLGA